MAAPTVVSSGTITAGGGSTTHTATPSLPVALATGDWVFAIIHWWNRNNVNAIGSVTETTGGWISVSEDFFNPFGTSVDCVIAIYRKAWTGGMAAPSFSLTGGNSPFSTYVAQTVGVRGAHPSTPIDAVGAAYQPPTDTTSIATPGLTTTGTDRLLILTGGKSIQATGYSTSPGVTQFGSINTGAGADAFAWNVYRTVASAGAVADQTFSVGGSSGTLIAKMFAIAPASATPDQPFTPDYIAPTTTFFNAVFTNSTDTVFAPDFLGPTTQFFTARFDQSFTPSFLSSPATFFDATFTAISGETGQPDQPVTLQRFSYDVFPPGTVVGIYEQHRAGIDRAPTGEALSQITVGALGGFDVTGLSENRYYVAYAFVGGKHRYLRFRYELSPS